MQVGVKTKLDGIDANQIRDMINSSPFQILTTRIAAELERRRLICEQSRDAVDVYQAQGAALALRTVLALPEAILKEIQGQAKK